MAVIDIHQQEPDYLEIQLAAIEEYLRYREKGHKIKVIFGSIMFLITASSGIYFHWLAKI